MSYQAVTESNSNGNGATSDKPSRERTDEANGFTMPQNRDSKNPFEGRQTHFTDDLWTYVSILTFIADVVSDLLVCIKYYREKNLWWFSLTLGFLLVASFAMQLFSAKWLLEDGKRQNCFTYLLHVLHLGPVLRYWCVLKSGWRARQRNADLFEFAAFLGEWRDISMLRLFQAFLQSAPQLVLQLYILVQRGRFELEIDLLTAVTAGCSLVSMIWAILAYSKSLRDFRRQGYTLSGAGLVFQILWRISMVTSRVVAMVLFASYFTKWLFVAAGAHWVIMTLWLICQRTRFCTDEDGSEHPFREKLFSAVIGFMYIFCFFNTREGMTRKRVVLYYSIILVENSLFVSMWYPHRTIHGAMALAALGVVWGGFGLGVLCMALYYRFYHPSLPVQGIFLQKKSFDLDGQRAYTLVCCCCCRVRGATLEHSYNETGEENLLRHVQRGTFQHGYPALELEILPRAPSREILADSSSSRKENHFNRTGLRDSSPGSPVNILVHSTPLSVGARGLYTNHPLVSNDVPEIVVTGASPEVVSPRDSISNSSLVTLNEFDLEFDNEVQPLTGVSLVEFANSALESTSGKKKRTREVPLQTKEPVEHDSIDARKESEEVAKNDRTRRELAFHDDTKDASIKSPSAGEIISWFHPAKPNETSPEEEDEKTEINYGSLSFGHRYSLVSSDCISLSSESSRSSLDSIVFADEGPGSSGARLRETRSSEFAPKPTDEGIFSDERDSPAKSSFSTSDEPDRHSEPSRPQGPRVNAQFPLLKEQDGSSETTEKSAILVSPNDDSYDLVELIMDATSPQSSLKRKEKSSDSTASSEETVTNDKGIELKLLNELERKEHHTLRKELVSEREDGHESESTDASSDSWIESRHRSWDEIGTGAIGVQTSPDVLGCGVNKRHTFDFSQLSKGGSSAARKRMKKHRRSKKRDFDNFVVTSLRPGKYSSLRRSIDRLAKIQEDTEETFLINTEAALNACSPDDELSTSPTPEPCELNPKDAIIRNQELPSSVDGSSTRLTAPEEGGVGSERASYVKRKRMKRFLNKELLPGKFSSVRCSDDTISSDDNSEGIGSAVTNRNLSSTTSADSFLCHLPVHVNSLNFDGEERRKKVGGKTASLPDVNHSTKRKIVPEVTSPEVAAPEVAAPEFDPPSDDTTKNKKTQDINHEDSLNSIQKMNVADNREVRFENNARMPAPTKRHSYDFGTSCRDHMEMKELPLGFHSDAFPTRPGWGAKRSAADRRQRRPQSEVVISQGTNSAVFV